MSNASANLHPYPNWAYVYTGGLTPGQDSAFLDELVEKVSPAYEIFRHGPVTAGPLVDLIVAEKLRVPDGFAGQAALGEAALAAWAASVEGAKPYRNAMQLVLDHFPFWWSAAGAGGQAALAEHLPVLAPAVGDLGDGGVSALIAVGEAALACAASYSMANGDAVRAIATIAQAGAGETERCGTVLNRLAASFPIKMIEESRDAERFLPALGKSVAAAGDGWAEAVELAVVLVTADPSSAFGTLDALPTSLGAVRGSRAEYLAQFAAVVRALGNRSAGLCLKRLPGAAAAQAAVERAVALAGVYGKLAAERFLERAL